MVNTYICFQCLSWPEKSLQSKKFEVQKKKKKKKYKGLYSRRELYLGNQGKIMPLVVVLNT